jgi:RNA polymerase sigma factor (TIGR02999 family)
LAGHVEDTDSNQLDSNQPGAKQSDDMTLASLLAQWQKGDGAAFASLFAQVYVELKSVAVMRIAQVSGNATLTPTELLHEAVLRVMDAGAIWQNRAHFFASMSIYMRSVLVDHARARQSDKRAAVFAQITLIDADGGEESGIGDLLALDHALNQLEQLDARSSAVLHLTYFAGLKRTEISDVLKVSPQVVDRELRFAKSWLNAQLDTAL